MQRTRGVVVIVFVAALAVVSGCTPGAPSGPIDPGPVSRKSVVVVGDSITWGASPQLTAAFNARNLVSSINSTPGTEVYQRRDEIRNVAALRPNVVVMSMGSNDMGSVENPFRSPQDQLNWYNWSLANMRGALDDLAAVPCVIWLTINDWTAFDVGNPVTGQYDLITWAPHYNNALRSEDAARANLRVLDFNAAVRAQGLFWMADNMDNIVLHFDTPTGNQWLANFIAANVSSICGV